MTHEDYVTFNQAKALKDLGFDWEVDFYYATEDAPDGHAWLTPFANGGKNANLKSHLYSAPTLSQAQKWLREVQCVDVVLFLSYPERERGYHFGLGKWFPYLNYLDSFHYETYEQALSAGIDEALAFLKEENK